MAGKKVIALCRKFYARVAICSATFKLLGTRKPVRERERERKERVADWASGSNN